MKNLKVWIILVVWVFSCSYAGTVDMLKKTQEEKELEITDFSAIKDVLKEDHLVKNVEKKISKVRKLKQKRLDQKREKFDIPSNKEFWKILSEYWLVQNVAILKWNFKKPNYGIEDRVIRLFKQVGLINISFKILLLNTSMVTHLYLPYENQEFLVMLSVPFMRSLNLSQLEIALLILEDYIRSTMKIAEKKIITVMGSDYIGRNYYMQRRINLSPFKQGLKCLDHLAFEEGFSFKEQFAVTKKMRLLLAGEDKLKKGYIGLLEKIAKLIELNPDYKNYVNFYPSPSIQIKWFVGNKRGK